MAVSSFCVVSSLLNFVFVSVLAKVCAHPSSIGRRASMRKTKDFEVQSRMASELRRLRELERENGVLRFLYADLLQKFSELKDGLTRNAGAC
jgi:hypothetical protein